MRLRLRLLLPLLASASCMLPDYKISDTSTNPIAKPLPGGSEDCNRCVSAHCSDLRSMCGKSCDDVTLPISPVMDLPEDVDPFMQCVVDQCDASCNVRWGCVGQYSWPAPSKSYNVNVRIADALSDQGVPNVKVSACQGSDPACSLGGGMQGTGTTDETGHVTLQLTSGFFGYFFIEAGGNYFPLIAFPSQPTYRVNTNFTINVFQRPWLGALADQVGAMLHDDGGHLIFRTENCLPLRFVGNEALKADAEGVTVSYGRQGPNTTRIFYVSGGLSIDPNATATTPAGSGYGGALNLPTGATSIVGTHGDLDVMNAALPMRSDVLAFVSLVPNGR